MYAPTPTELTEKRPGLIISTGFNKKNKLSNSSDNVFATLKVASQRKELLEVGKCPNGMWAQNYTTVLSNTNNI